MATPIAVDGSLGLRVDIPADWTLLQDEQLAAVWRTPDGVLVLISHLPEAVLVEPELLEDYRQDLRLIAAARGGGLVACELNARLGVVGITKEVRPSGDGVAAVGRAIVPTPQGHAAVSVVADAPGRPAPGGADPYGYRYEQPGAEDGGLTRWTWPRELALLSPEDSAERDAAEPGRPLARVRAVMNTLRERMQRASQQVIEPPGAIAVDGVSFDLPMGFLPAERGRLTHGQLYRRVSFEKRVSFLTVCRHPDAPNACRMLDAARTLLDRHLAASGAQVLKGPRVDHAPVAGRAAVVAEHESLIGSSLVAATRGGHGNSIVGDRGHATHVFTALLPWLDHTLEVSAFGERDDWPRARSTVEAAARRLEQTSNKPAIVADTARIPGVTPAGRRRVFRILCHLAHCDGSVGDTERGVLTRLREELRIEPAEAEQLEQEGARGEKLDLSKNPAEQQLLIAMMIEVVAADGVLDNAERRRMMEIAEATGIPKALVTEQLVDRFSGGQPPS